MENKLKNKNVLFIDLDGTLITTASGDTFPKGVWDVLFKFDVFDKIKEWAHIPSNKPKYVIIVTNQGGIEIGKVDEQSFKSKMYYIRDSIFDYVGLTLEQFSIVGCYCITNNKSSNMRKPNTGLLIKGLEDLGISDTFTKEEMFMVGDASGLEGQFSNSDKKTAENFGIDYLDVSEFMII